MGDHVRPFSNGSQFGDWCASNCDRCAKAELPLTPKGEFACEIMEALSVAYWGDGTVDAEMAARMGITPETRGRYNWPCAEVEWTAAWKAEWQARHEAPSGREA
jgi:hypothetical protein